MLGKEMAFNLYQVQGDYQETILGEEYMLNADEPYFRIEAYDGYSWSEFVDEVLKRFTVGSQKNDLNVKVMRRGYPNAQINSLIKKIERQGCTYRLC